MLHQGRVGGELSGRRSHANCPCHPIWFTGALQQKARELSNPPRALWKWSPPGALIARRPPRKRDGGWGRGEREENVPPQRDPRCIPSHRKGARFPPPLQVAFLKKNGANCGDWGWGNDAPPTPQNISTRTVDQGHTGEGCRFSCRHPRPRRGKKPMGFFRWRDFLSASVSQSVAIGRE